MTPFIAEIIGTMFLITLGGGVVANVLLNLTKGNNSGWIVITTGWALGVYAGVVIAGPYSGAHLNPAVTIGLAVAGKFPWESVPIYLLGEIIGAMSGALIVWIVYRNHFEQTEDTGLKRAVFCTDPAIRKPLNNLISEIVGTFFLVFAIFFFTDASFQQNETETIIGMGSIGAIPVALIVWAIGLSLGGTTGYAINPARDLGPRIIHAILPIKGSSDWGYAWIPVVGPIIGGVMAAVLYGVVL
ncbi:MULTISPECIES: MIP/aquaporin family protein [Maribacter]|jgi:glycerol uptake facilitator protein|uniref:MIP/aquaporin family protein n=1 Tax=Maribacter TaxID=252356 RepID=UPI000E313ABA|nr:MIP/aquaporin family protein [Maribacter litoralis]|tara:strand:+ start:5464 stop:6192 length:729 start_codon:yes stop_codon:yes gene_type:complete